jgi:hypothetical protein
MGIHNNPGTLVYTFPPYHVSAMQKGDWRMEMLLFLPSIGTEVPHTTLAATA